MITIISPATTMNFDKNSNLKDFSKEKLGDENYNAIVEAKDELVEYSKEAIDIIGDVGSDLLDSGKEYIKNWYENFRN